MFLTSAFALLIQPDLNLLAYDDSLNNSVASKIELTIPEISKRELNKVRREEAKRLKNKQKELSTATNPKATKKKFTKADAKKQAKEVKKNIKQEIATFDIAMPSFHKSVEEKQLDYEYNVRKRELREQYEKSLDVPWSSVL